MSFDPFKTEMPVKDIIWEIRERLIKENTLIVTAPAGAGKSTLLPLALADEPWLNGKKILILEPRRLAARMIAERMSEMLGEEPGETVGYRIRFEARCNPKTRIEVLTEGILTRMIHSDNALENAGLVIFDEFHERSIHADITMALCREIQQVLRPELRILVMSATLDIPGLSKLLNASVIESRGRQYPVEINYMGTCDETLLPETTAATAMKATKENQGDILVFLPGQGEILKCAEILQKQLPGFAIHPLYGLLPQNRQKSAVLPDRQGRRKVVLATSIAETSITIQGTAIVIDCGFGRRSRFDHKSGLSRLETIRISKDSADQRTGRAGRTGPGVCYRMWTRAAHEKLAECRTPEILEADLCPLVLDMAQWGIQDIYRLTWLDPPLKSAVTLATETLQQLDALCNGKITLHGKRIHALPCHPRIAHMLLKATDDGIAHLACDLAAIIEERDPLPPDTGIDINLRIEALRRYRSGNNQGGKMEKIEKIAGSYRKMLKINLNNTEVNPYETGLLLAYAYPERIASARPGNNAQFLLSNGRLAVASHKDDLAYESWLAVAHVDAREGLGKIFLASPLNPKDLSRIVREYTITGWDTRKGGILATKELRIGSIVLQSSPLPFPDESEITAAICKALAKEGENLLNFDEEVTQWQNRVLSLKKWRPEDDWPDVRTDKLLQSCESWIKPCLSGVRKPDDLKKINIRDALHFRLDRDKQLMLDKLAPQTIEVPTGSNIRLKYLSGGESPVLAVRLQEIFGLTDTPCINQGKIPVLMHLLSPGFKPVQVTKDLKSFWNKTYFDVRKDLKGRYPKHYWPDNPATAMPVAGAKRKTNR